MTRPIRWDKIAEQYDQMVKYATAIRTGTASTEAILRRFMKANAVHPIYQAMIELGRAQKTIFLARYLRSQGLQREINDGLNAIESWNRANSIIFYGKNNEIASNRRDEQEMSVLCLRICQAAMVYLLTELPEGAVQFRGRGVVGVGMVPVCDRQRRGRTGPDSAVLVACAALRRDQTQHGHPARARRVLTKGNTNVR